jgi:hypothetical protein
MAYAPFPPYGPFGFPSYILLAKCRFIRQRLESWGRQGSARLHGNIFII